MPAHIDPSLYPFASHYLDLGYLRLHYLDEGQGQPIVMLHGNPTWSFYYRNLVIALRDQQRCIVPDHIGDGLLAPYDTPAHRLAVLRFVQTIPLRPGDAGYDLVSEIERGLEQFRDTPMLICWGMKDFIFDRHFLAAWKRHFPKAEIARFAD